MFFGKDAELYAATLHTLVSGFLDISYIAFCELPKPANY